MKDKLKQLLSCMKFKLDQWMLGVFAGLLGVILYLSPVAGFLEIEHGLYGLFKVRGGISVPEDVVVVAIDQSSATNLGLPLTPSLWPRKIHAELIRVLSNAGARVIVFDLIFDKPGLVPENDIQLLEAMEASRNVIVAERLIFEDASNFLTEQSDPSSIQIITERPAKLLPIFSKAALGHAPFPLPRAARVNSFWTFKTSAGDIPTVPVLALQAYALPAYDDLLRLLKLCNSGNVGKLPVRTETVDFSDLILTLRNIFTHSTQIKQEMLQAVEQDLTLTTAKQRQLRALINLYAGDGMRYLNLYGPPRTIKTVPYDQALKPIDAEWATRHFKDKVIFIGFSAATQPEQDKVRDDYHTVFSNVDGLYVSGVELAATAFANLLDNRSIKPSSSPESLLALFLLGFVVGVVFLDLRISVWQAIFWGLIPILVYISFTHYQFKATGAWQPWIVPIVQTLCALFGALLLRYLAAKRDWERLEAAFGLFLPARIVDDISKNAGLVTTGDSQLVYGACLATDAEKYTELGATMDPRSLGQFMNDYYGVLFNSVKKHQGIISDVVGDAMLALWTAPSLDIALRQQACLAGLNMAEAIERFNQASDHPHLPTRIGLHFGEMLLGHIGAIQHYEYRAVGDVVNTTNRIQGVNKHLGTRLLVSSEVVVGLEEFLIRPLGGFLLVGRSASIDLAELVACKHEASPQQLELCEAFSKALHAYQSQQWQAACDAFLQILETHPKDGPAIYFLQRCQSLIDTRPSDSWDPTIEMDVK